MTTRFFCPNCWREIDERAVRCPYCEYDISEFASLSYEEKLIYTLRHPIRENRMMAIQSLGELESEEAVPVFASILETEKDFYVIREIILSLAKIGNKEGKSLIRRMRVHKSKLVRKIAEQVNGT